MFDKGLLEMLAELELLPDGVFEVTMPGGAVRATRPPPIGLFAPARAAPCAA